MQKKMVYPQEIVVWHILPFIRRELSLELKNEGYDQKTIASLLGITEAAVSMYMNEKRACIRKTNKAYREQISISAKRIVKKDDLISEVQRLIELPETKKMICSIHKQEFGKSKYCKLCTFGGNR